MRHWLGQNASRETAHQVGILLYIWKREWIYRSSMAILLSSALIWVYSVPKILPMLIAFAMAEFILARIAWPYCKQRHEITNGTNIVVQALCIIISFQYFIPALLLATHEGFTIKLMGLFWLAGSTAYTANTFGAIPRFYWATFIPSVLILCIATVIIYTNDTGAVSSLTWMYGLLFAAMYIYNSSVMLVRQKDTQNALVKARESASQRMQELEYLSQSDRLTGLANRASFDKKLQGILSNAKQSKHKLAVYFIDLDKFKPINDYLGHQAGDQVLKEIGERLHAFASPHGFAARLGGDEFALVINDASDDATALRHAEDIATLIQAPIAYDKDTLIVSASVGVARAHNVEHNLMALCKAADQAMFSVKHDPDKSVALYDPIIFAARATLVDKMELEQAIKDGDIRPYYQPKYDMLTGQISGFEALARWDHSQGQRAPSTFLPKLEELNMMSQLTFAMIRHVLADIEKWLDMGFNPHSVSINIDETTLATVTGRQDLLWVLSEQPDTLGFVTLEVTEDVVLARAGDFIRKSIEKITELGVRISLDDFGTGFASFQHLRQLVPNELKIDTSFVTTIGVDATSKVIIEGFLSIAAGLNIAVVAEGVETEEQRDFLLERGCNIGQGFLFSPAIPFDACCTLLEQDHGQKIARLKTA